LLLSGKGLAFDKRWSRLEALVRPERPAIGKSHGALRL
jgi:hypothetical protein